MKLWERLGISKKALKDIDKSAVNFRKGIVSGPIDLDYDEACKELDEEFPDDGIRCYYDRKLALCSGCLQDYSWKRAGRGGAFG